MKELLTITIIFCCCLAKGQEVSRTPASESTWKLTNVGLRYQSTLQSLPDLDYASMASLSSNPAAQTVDMSSFGSVAVQEFFGESVGVYLGMMRPLNRGFSHYIELGVDHNLSAEYLVEYATESNSSVYDNLGWCVIQTGINAHLRYALNYQWKFIQFRAGPTFTYGTSYNAELLLLQDDLATGNYSEERLGEIPGTRSWVAYFDLQTAVNVYKNLDLTLQGKWGSGKVNGFDENVQSSTVFGIGIEYQIAGN